MASIRLDLNVLSAPALIIWNNAVTLVSCKALETNPTAIGIKMQWVLH